MRNEDVSKMLDLRVREKPVPSKHGVVRACRTATASAVLSGIALFLALVSLMAIVGSESDEGLDIAVIAGFAAFVIGVVSILLSLASMLVVRWSRGTRIGYRRAVVALLVCLATAGVLFGAMVVLTERAFAI